MRRKRLLWQLYPSYLLITIASLVAVTWFASYSLEQIFVDTERRNLEQQARIIDELLGPAFKSGEQSKLQRVCRQVTSATSTRVTVIDRQGNVLCDTKSEGPLENHADRRELLSALAGNIGTDMRSSRTLGATLLYVAIPLERAGSIVGAIRTSVPLESIAQERRWFQARVATGGIVIAGLAALVSLVVARRISRPLEEMRFGAERFARGELGYKMMLPDSEEMAGLAETLNVMAQQLQERIGTMVRQKSEQDAVLASMVEGVLAVDADARVISMNHAAIELLAVPAGDVSGRRLEEVVRSAPLSRFAARALEAKTSIEGDFVVRVDPPRVLQAHGTPLADSSHRGIGAVIVLNDVTRFRQLEDMRREFVANVSHELKTPITSIKGFVETLLDGAMDNREDAQRFLRIVARQAERLNAIIEDLLRLSKIEQSEEAADIALVPTALREVLVAAVTDCQTLAAERQVEVELECDPTLEARVNAPLMEQAVVNLLNNAIKYSESGGSVSVRASAADGLAAIAVCDQGCGIAAEHLPRIFERFYRVDRARSRKLGGTGLGLSIVKHIATAHQGRVAVESTPGKGSIFTIYVPL